MATRFRHVTLPPGPVTMRRRQSGTGGAATDEFAGTGGLAVDVPVREGRPVPSSVTPVIVTHDLERPAHFYTGMVGAMEPSRTPDDGADVHLGLRVGDSELGLVADGSVEGTPAGRVLLSFERLSTYRGRSSSSGTRTYVPSEPFSEKAAQVFSAVIATTPAHQNHSRRHSPAVGRLLVRRVLSHPPPTWGDRASDRGNAQVGGSPRVAEDGVKAVLRQVRFACLRIL